MRPIRPIGTLTFSTVTFMMEDFSPIEVITGILTIALLIFWLIQGLYNYKSKKKSDKLEEEEQRAEIEKHKAETEYFKNKKN